MEQKIESYRESDWESNKESYETLKWKLKDKSPKISTIIHTSWLR